MQNPPKPENLRNHNGNLNSRWSLAVKINPAGVCPKNSDGNESANFGQQQEI